MSLRHIAVVTALLSLCGPWVLPALAGTAVDLSDRVIIDGFSDEFLQDELMFQPTFSGRPEESTIDSQWGTFNDLNQIKITWDAKFLYVAVDAFIFDNNTMIFFDTVPLPDGSNPGLTSLSQVNSWKRAVSFDNGIFPDLFMATWDRNTTPQVWQFTGSNQVAQVPEGSFETVATFSGDLPGRSMEAAIPWEVVFLGEGTREFNSAYGDTVYQLPREDAEIRIVAWITTGSDGLGGPDSAPDNLSGHQVDSAVPVVLDNYIRLPIDRFNSRGEPVPDGVPDFDRQVRTPTSELPDEQAYADLVSEFFFVPPPIRGRALEIAEMSVEPRAIAPDMGDRLGFRFTVTPRIEDPALREARTVSFTAEVYDLNGERVRTIYRDEAFTLDDLDLTTPPERNVFDGRDDSGAILEGGIYVLRVVLEPGQDQIEKPMVVVR